LIDGIMFPQEISKYTKVPGGYAHQDCIYTAENGAHLRRRGDELVLSEESGVRVLPRCKFPMIGRKSHNSPLPTHGPAWKTWAQFQVSNLTNVVGSWNVPPNPSSIDSQLLYFWNGIEC